MFSHLLFRILHTENQKNRDAVYVDYFTRIIFWFINVHVTLISRIIHVYGIQVYSSKDLDAFNFVKTCHREIKVTLKLSTYTVHVFTSPYSSSQKKLYVPYLITYVSLYAAYFVSTFAIRIYCVIRIILFSIIFNI